MACADLVGGERAMDAPLAPRSEGEVLDRVRHEQGASWDPRPFQRLVQDTTCGADEGVALPIFLVARLLAYQHDGHRPVARAA
jgi:hypothetical protein